MTASGYILAIDQGTTSTRALIVDHRGAVVSEGHATFPQYFPWPGWVEHGPEEIWSSVLVATENALAAAAIEPAGLAAIGIANQRETVITWERATGRPVGRAIVWQDRRSAAICEELRAAGLEQLVQSRTGLTIDPYFSGTKLAWLLRADPALRERAESGEILAGTVDSWLVWKLTGGRAHLTDVTNASRTMLFNIHHRSWDPDLCGLLGVPAAMLPTIMPCVGPFGYTEESIFGAAIPILGVAGDQQAALAGQACFGPGEAKNTYGTGSFLLAHAGATIPASQHRLLVSPTAEPASAPCYAIEGSVFVAGALVQWLRDGLGIIRSSDEVEALAASVPDAASVVIVPALAGLGAPDWDAGARGAILGITRGAGRAHIARAALEAIALSSAELVGLVEADLGRPLHELRVDGGAARNNLLMQLQADFAGIPVLRPTNVETTALGAAYLAGIGAGIWSGPEEVASLWQMERRFEPQLSEDGRLERLQNWRGAVRRVLTQQPGDLY